MEGKHKISKIICPMCQKEILIIKSGGLYDRWVCNCAHSWPSDWFDIFTQFERFVLREGGDVEKWIKNYKGRMPTFRILK